MRMFRILFTLALVLIPIAGCPSDPPGGGDPSWQAPPPPPPSPSPQPAGKRCGTHDPHAQDIIIPVAADGTVAAQDQYRFFERNGQKITWELQAPGKRLVLVFDPPIDDEDNGTTYPNSPFTKKRHPPNSDTSIRVMRTGASAANCGAYKYTIEVWNGATREAEVDPILIIRE